MKLAKIKAKTVRHMVYEQLREKIISAEILPGEQISLRDLAGKLGVSLMPVREALWQLESENVIVIEMNKSMHVNNLTPTQMDEILRIRLVLEAMAAERACDLRPESALPKLERLLCEMDRSVTSPKRYLEKNRRFHFTLYSLADSPILLDMIDGLWARVGPYLYIVTQRSRNLSTSMKYHYEIFDGLVKRDKKRIVAGLHGDLETAAEVMKPLLDSFATENTGGELRRFRVGTLEDQDRGA
ncbi:MAG: GntR family transcriptional regulator [Thermodesulfobacteriota bacterium]